MKTILLLLTVCISFSFANDDISEHKKLLLEKQLKIEIANEKKYSIEQTFYNYDNYDFNGAKVNKESLKHIPDLEMDELDMDSVYD